MKNYATPPAAMSRRSVLGSGLGFAAAMWLGQQSSAQTQPAGDAAGGEPSSAQVDAALPLDTYGLEHVGTVVPDVTRAARFFSSVFNPVLYKERAEPLRYYVTLDPGYIALGSRAGETRAFIDHDCALLRTYDRAAMARRLAKDGLPAGRAGVVQDPDGLGLQLLGGPGGLAASTELAARLVDGEPLVRPRGLAHVIHYVADLERSAAFYRKFFGPERSENGRVVFRAAHTLWIIERAPDGEAPRIDRVGINAARFDPKAVTRGLEKLGARIVTADAARLHFRSPDGLGIELLPVDPARIWGLASG